uniref:Uncharacterized protein n=1 Tax=Oryza sativa subsp. japonica TaxID=39947 RepID=Q84NS5_ORYSJ|nr:hypothetical protein [Oryza sativa Japonica Group]
MEEGGIGHAEDGEGEEGEELKVLQVSLPDSSMSAPEILKFVMDADLYPNVSVAYRILLTVLVTSFS